MRSDREVPTSAVGPAERWLRSEPAVVRRPPTPVAGRAAGRELEAVEELLAQGQLQAGAERLAVLLRMDAALAPVILSIADRAIAAGGRSVDGVSALHIVRGDAYRGMGRQLEADAAYQEAMRALPARPPTKESS
jgi:hypothetical protein